MNTLSVTDHKRSKSSKRMLVTLIAASPIIFWIVSLFS